MLGVVASHSVILAPVYQSSSAAAVATAVAAVSPTKPTGLAAGDLLLAFCWANNSASTWTCTTGGMSAAAGNGAIGCQNFQRRCDGTESTFTFTRATSTTGAGGAILVRVSGGVFNQSSVASGGATLTIDLGTVNPPVSTSLLLQIASMVTNSVAAWTAPGTATKRVDTTASGTAVEYAVGDEVVPSGSTGVRTWTHTVSQATRGAMFAITPAA